MKISRQKKHVTPYILVAFVLLLVIFLCMEVHNRINDDSMNEKEKQAASYSIDTYVSLAKTAGERVFLNKGEPEPTAGDERTKFKILEIIPHDVCSVFPYMVDWKTEEEYDKNVPIGYEGLLAASIYAGSGVQMFSDEEATSKDSKPYTIKKQAVKSLQLSDYMIEIGPSSNPKGKWYRETKNGAEGLLKEDGYFEYVGEGKGLYYLAAYYVANKSQPRGIQWEIQAIERKGVENPKGELYVKDPAYYWSIDHISSAKPQYRGDAVISQTGYDYNLSFSADTKGKYTADLSKIKTSTDMDFEYLLCIDDAKINDWVNGFSFQKKGNYIIDSAEISEKGNYIRISDSIHDDKFLSDTLQIDKGFFRLYEEATDGIVTKRYNIKLKEDDAGFYVANPPLTWNSSEKGYYFKYVGIKKGIYHVPFLYTEAGKDVQKYKAYVEKVTVNQGEYSLTSTTISEEKTPVYTDEAGANLPKDYAKVITQIDFTDAVAEKGVDDIYNSGIGVALGGTGENEKGGWIFVPVTDSSEMEVSFLSKVQKNSYNQNSNTDTFFKKGTRVYVKNQERRYRYYCRDGFYNNEWFKLLCYSNNPQDAEKPYTEMINGTGYDFDKTAAENLANENTKLLLKGFDQEFRIVIEQKTPEEVTPEDIENADLIYISNQEGVNGLAGNWDNISDARVSMKQDGLTPLIEKGNIQPFTDEQDLSPEVLMTIYDECIYERNRALIVVQSVIDGDDVISRNMTKLYYMMNFYDEAEIWAYFLPGLYPDVAVDAYSKINNDATVNICKDNKYQRYNHEFIDTEDGGNAEYSIENWNMDYFKIWEDNYGDHSIYHFNYDIGALKNTVLEGDTKLALAYYLAGIFMDPLTKDNIWKILNNRQLDTSKIIVEIINGTVTSETVTKRVIYADEFDPASFNIRYKIFLLGSSKKPVILQNITLSFEDGTLAGNAAGKEFDTEYVNNVRAGYTLDRSENGTLNPAVTMRKVTITANATNDKVGSADVYVILREAFNLN